jgi:hypothetical protein
MLRGCEHHEENDPCRIGTMRRIRRTRAGQSLCQLPVVHRV